MFFLLFANHRKQIQDFRTLKVAALLFMALCQSVAGYALKGVAS